MLIRSLLPGKWEKWMRPPSGREIKAARLQEVAEIASDLPAISITSGSKDMISWMALVSPSQSSVNQPTTTGFLGFLATGLGIPLGWGFSKGILTALSHTYGFGEVHVTLNLVHIILLFPLMVGISITGSYIPSRRAAKLAIVKVLRNE